jgi:sugar-specific transcriptional regulator TrmB
MLQTKITAIQKLNKIYNEQKKTVIPHEGVRVFKGNQCREFIIKSINEASKEVLIFCKQSSHKVRNDLEIQALKRGVTFRCLYERACLNDSNFLPLCKKVLNRGEIGRTIGLLPMNMFVVDDTIAAVMEVDKEKKGMTIFVFNQPVLITAMKQNFQYLWLQGSDIKNV